MAFLITTATSISNAQVVINEYSASNLDDYPDNYGKYEDWVELHNMGSSTVNLAGFHMSDKLTNPTKWVIPNGISIPAGGYVIFWCDGRDEISGGQFHTNFKLQQTKSNPETLVLADAQGNIVQQRQLEVTLLGHSRGRVSGNNWGVYLFPSPGQMNGSIAADGYGATPTINTAPGFYAGTQIVSITNNEPNSTIHYTIDGKDVGSNAPMYTGPITISNTTVLKCRAFSTNSYVLPSLIAFSTFFINETHTLPVISIAGSNLDVLANGNQNLRPHGSFEYFTPSAGMITRGYGEFNSHGQDSWVNDQRSLDWITRDEMGYARHLKVKMYPQSDRDEFQRVILRCEGDDNYFGIDTSAHMRDMFVHTITQDHRLHLDVRKAAKCIVYLNGDYWGVYSLREKVDDPDFTEYYHGQDKYNIEFIMTWGNTWIEFGDPGTLNRWDTFWNFINSNNMAIQSNYDFVDSLYDVRSLVDYVLVNNFSVCSDWLNWNVGWWRGLNPAGEHKKWGYILWDNDATFGHYRNYTFIPGQTPFETPCFHEGLNNNQSDPEGHIDILLKLRANPTFNQYYISRYIDLMNTTFSCDNLLDIMDSINVSVLPEMQRHCTRWGGDYTEWTNNIVMLRNFIIDRCNHINSGLNSCYQLTGPYDVKFNVSPPGAGVIYINSIKPDNYPWQGKYHGNIPILLRAQAKQANMVFDRWEIINHSVSPVDTVPSVQLTNISSGDSIIAHFKPGIVGIDEHDIQSSISVVPNPYSDFTNITVSGNVVSDHLSVYNLIGKEVKNYQPSSKNQFLVDREGMAPGIYIFRVIGRSGEVIGSGKLIVE
ncbi:MAG: T9SS type A sorting domain-containing protein [Bacteroidia bacterium]|nr:T9SS type A sorting domain-containing protein [Bacteroidia bacterium]